MKRERIKHLTALCLALILLLSGCGGPGGRNAAPVMSAEKIGQMELRYAEQFSVDYYADGTSLITIGGTDRYLLLPEGSEAPDGAAGGVTVLRQPLDCIYLAASSAMDFFRRLELLDTVRMTSTKTSDWSLPEVRAALDEGRMLYAGKYSAPDYELVLSEGADVAVESTMIYHSPETKEQLEALGIPVLVERSSYESDPLGRLEWIKLYGLLAGREEDAAAFFDGEVESLAGMNAEDTGKTAAFFYLSTGGYAVVRKPGDYISRMIRMAGGAYILPEDIETEDNALSTMKMEMESFYEAARDADVLFYNSTVEGQIDTLDELLSKSELLRNFKAVQEGNVWCTEQNVFQESTGIGGMILDMNRILTGEADGSDELTYFHKVT